MSENNNRKLTAVLNKFNKDDLLENVLESSNNGSTIKKKTKQAIVKQAIKVLREQFSDLDELSLFLNLKYLELQKSKRSWTVFQLKNGKRLSMLIPSSEISQYVQKYFKKYHTPCKIDARKKGKSIWMALYIGDGSTALQRPVFVVVRTDLSAIFISHFPLRKHQLVTEKVLRKVFKASEIQKISTVSENVHYIQNLNFSSFKNLQNDLSDSEVIYSTNLKRKRVYLNSESEHEDENIEDNQRKRKTPERDIVSQSPEKNNIPQSPERILRKCPKRNILLKSPKRDILAKLPKKNILPKSPERDIIHQPPERDIIAQAPERDDTLQSPEKNNIPHSPEKIDRKYPKRNILLKSPKRDILSKHPKRNMFSKSPERDIIPQSPRRGIFSRKEYLPPEKNIRLTSPEKAISKSLKRNILPEYPKKIILPKSPNRNTLPKPSKRNIVPKSSKRDFTEENLPITENLKYCVRSRLLEGGEKKNAANFSICVAEFHGKSVLNGLKELTDSGIADGPLPDYLYMEPRTGKTQFTMTL